MLPVPILLPNGTSFDHLLDEEHQLAIQGAAAANRPLLVRGEPGLGKSQLAYAAASLLGRKFISFTISATTESQDLLWTFDAVQRLAESQVAANTLRGSNESNNESNPAQSPEAKLREAIDVKKFIHPGPLWWAIDWDSANHANRDGLASAPTWVSTKKDSWTPDQGLVILIDEIDKAESSVPNGLLEVFGARQLQPLGWSKPIVSKPNTKSPLVMITTNEERMLPTAFLRRCFVLELELLPCVDSLGGEVQGEKRQKFLDYFVELGKAHFKETLPLKVYEKTAEMLLEDRAQAFANQDVHKPGPAEYIDLLCALQGWDSVGLTKTKSTERSTEDLLALCGKLEKFVFRKNSRALR